MAWFEVFIPSLEAGAPGITLTLEAPNWIGALRTGLQNIGEGQSSISNVMCDIKEDNSIHVTDVASHRVFRLREVPKPGATTTPPTTAPPATPSVSSPKAPGADGGFSSGSKTLLEFQRPDFSKLPPPAPSMPSMPPPRQTTDVDDAPDTIQMAAATTPEAPRLPVGQSIEMSIPWATMPAPSSAPSPSVTLPSSSAPVTAPARATPVALEAPTGTSSTPPADKGYDLTLRQPKAPASALPQVPRDVSMPPESPVAPPSPAAFPPLPPAPRAEPTPAAPSPTPAAPSPTPSPTPAKAAPAQPTPEKAAPASPPSPAAATSKPTTPPTSPPTTPTSKGAAPVEQTEKVTTRSTVPSQSAASADVTERLPRAPDAKKTGPVPAPTPRGTTAPPPKRKSGQFESAPQPVKREVSRESPVLTPGDRASAEAIADAVADVFDATQDLLMEGVVEPRRIAEALLDIALAHVPAESGSFYLADLNGHVLSFAAVRGPKADAIMRGRFTVPVGQGIIGFCALEGICLRVADMQKDPHYSAQIANAVGYVVKDTLCASAEKDGRLYGAIQLINARQGFTAAHMEVLRYIGLTAAQLLERHFETV